jgi:hypothetical protein
MITQVVTKPNLDHRLDSWLLIQGSLAMLQIHVNVLSFPGNKIIKITAFHLKHGAPRVS